MRKGVILDLRPRCRRCNKIPRGKMRLANWERYKPYCSYHCQEWARLESAQAYINRLRERQDAEEEAK